VKKYFFLIFGRVCAFSAFYISLSFVSCFF